MSVSKANTVEEPEQFRKLFVGRLNFKTTNDSLKEFFEKWGDVVEAVVMKYPLKTKSRGFGFVTYSKAFMADDALANGPHKIDGRNVLTKRAIPQDDIDLKVKKIFVSGIKEETEEELRKYFGKYGNILDIQIITNRETGQRKGFGFIEFDNSDSVDKAVCLKNNHQVSGNKLEVKKAVSKNGAPVSRGQRGGCVAGSGRGQNWGRPNNVGKEDDVGDNQSGYRGGPLRENFGNNTAALHPKGRRGSGNYHQNARGRY